MRAHSRRTVQSDRLLGWAKRHTSSPNDLLFVDGTADEGDSPVVYDGIIRSLKNSADHPTGVLGTVIPPERNSDLFYIKLCCSLR